MHSLSLQHGLNSTESKRNSDKLLKEYHRVSMTKLEAPPTATEDQHPSQPDHESWEECIHFLIDVVELRIESHFRHVELIRFREYEDVVGRKAFYDRAGEEKARIWSMKERDEAVQSRSQIVSDFDRCVGIKKGDLLFAVVQVAIHIQEELRRLDDPILRRRLEGHASGLLWTCIREQDLDERRKYGL